MIRIDEIYNNTFWPWIRQNAPLTRMFFLDPFGSTNPDDLKNFGDDITEHNYIFMHDQEPIDLALHRNLFDDVQRRNLDLNNHRGPDVSAIITSERDSDKLDAACERYGWKSFYYFFHGWASLDWYRGYDKTFLIAPAAERQIKHSFISPNRIIGGQRQHRVLLIYHLLKNQIKSALISCPTVCPVEGQQIQDIGSNFLDLYPDIKSVLAAADLPWHFQNETDHPMHSCWLSLFDQSAQTLAYVVTETVYFGRRLHLTEKTFRPICLQMPFVMVSTQGSLAYLRSYGFKTFRDFWDESYDHEPDDVTRLEKIVALLTRLDQMTSKQRQDLYQSMLPIIQHNYEHFYSGAFEKILWQEFQSMLENMRHCFHTK